jgi:hypothetical protein
MTRTGIVLALTLALGGAGASAHAFGKPAPLSPEKQGAVDQAVEALRSANRQGAVKYRAQTTILGRQVGFNKMVEMLQKGKKVKLIKSQPVTRRREVVRPGVNPGNSWGGSAGDSETVFKNVTSMEDTHQITMHHVDDLIDAGKKVGH